MVDAGRESAACEGGQRQDGGRDAHDGRFQRASKERLRWVVVSQKLDGYLASARSWPAILIEVRKSIVLVVCSYCCLSIVAVFVGKCRDIDSVFKGRTKAS